MLVLLYLCLFGLGHFEADVKLAIIERIQLTMFECILFVLEPVLNYQSSQRPYPVGKYSN